MLENGSFNYVQPEDLNHTLEMYEGRLIEAEHRLDEHEKLHLALDAEQSSSSSTRRRFDDVNASFGSNQSIQSTTSSVLISAALNRKETGMEIESIKDRLDVLESTTLPTSLKPWEIEVVLLPWGPELRGIWFSPDEPMHDPQGVTTQNSEEWTQARNRQKDHSHPSTSLVRDTDSSPHSGRSDSI